MKKSLAILIYLFIILITVLFIAFGIFKWPGLHHDAALYTTPIINLAQVKGWIFESYAYTLVNRSSNQYDFHGFLYQLVFGLIFKTSSYERIFLLSGLINSASFLIYTYLAYQKLGQKANPIDIFLSINIGIMAGIICLYLQGRPEHLIPLIMSIPLLLSEFKFAKKYIAYVSYIIGGLLFILSPLTSVAYGLGLIYWLTLRSKRPTQLFVDLASAIILSSITCMVMIEIFRDFSTLTWIHNVLSARDSTPQDWSVFINSSSILTAPGWNLIIICLVLVALANLMAKKHFLIASILVFIGIYLTPRSQLYTYVGFLPFILALTVNQTVSFVFISKFFSKFIKLSVISISCLYFALLVRTFLTLILYLQYGVSFDEAKLSLGGLGSSSPNNHDSIAFMWLSRPSFIVFNSLSTPLVTAEPSLFEGDGDNLLIEYQAKFDRNVRFLVMPQVGHIDSPLESIDLENSEYRLVHSGWISQRARFMGIKLGGSMPGYQYCLYEKV
jgi:hypothetical protein